MEKWSTIRKGKIWLDFLSQFKLSFSIFSYLHEMCLETLNVTCLATATSKYTTHSIILFSLFSFFFCFCCALTRLHFWCIYFPSLSCAGCEIFVLPCYVWTRISVLKCIQYNFICKRVKTVRTITVIISHAMVVYRFFSLCVHIFTSNVCVCVYVWICWHIYNAF